MIEVLQKLADFLRENRLEIYCDNQTGAFVRQYDTEPVTKMSGPQYNFDEIQVDTASRFGLYITATLLESKVQDNSPEV